MQRTDCHTDQLGNFLSGLSSLHQILDLLYFLWRKLYLPSPRSGRGAKLCCHLSHYYCTLYIFWPPSLLLIGAAYRVPAAVAVRYDKSHWALPERASTDMLAKSAL